MGPLSEISENILDALTPLFSTNVVFPYKLVNSDRRRLKEVAAISRLYPKGAYSHACTRRRHWTIILPDGLQWLIKKTIASK